MKNNIDRGRFKFILSNAESTFILEDITAVELPGIDQSATEIPLRNGYMGRRTSGNPITWSDLNIEFLVDEYMDNYFYFYDWMMGQNSPITGNAEDKVMTGVLLINRMDKTTLREIEFKGIQPLSIPNIRFESTSEDTQFELANVTLSIDYMTSKRGK